VFAFHSQLGSVFKLIHIVHSLLQLLELVLLHIDISIYVPICARTRAVRSNYDREKQATLLQIHTLIMETSSGATFIADYLQMLENKGVLISLDLPPHSSARAEYCANFVYNLVSPSSGSSLLLQTVCRKQLNIRRYTMNQKQKNKNKEKLTRINNI